MAFINLLHNGYQGKLGETVGQKWKNQRTVRTYSPHNTSKSLDQVDVRNRYKKNITAASECYPYLFGAQFVRPKNMNRFNAFTSAIDKIYNAKYEELVKTGVFKRHTGIQLQPVTLYLDQAKGSATYIVFDEKKNPLVRSIKKIKVVGILVKKTTATIEPPVINTSDTEAFVGVYVIRAGITLGNYGATFHFGGTKEDVKGSVVQFSFTIDGKEHIQKPVVIGDMPAENMVDRKPAFSKSIIQTF